MNKLQAMEVFVQVVDAGSFSRAADQLQLPKATVSSLLQQLEQGLRVRLLHRTTRRLSLTADGAAYYERCVRILSDVRDAEESLSRTRASPSGRLRVDVSTGIGNHLLIPALPDFFARYPDITLELGCSDRPVDLIEENVDCALRAGELADSSLIARRIGVLQFVVAAAPAYLARHGRPAQPQDLAAHRCIHYFSHRTGKVYDWEFARGDQRIALNTPWNLAVNDSVAYLRAGLEGLGVVRLASFSALPLIRAGQLERLLPEWEVGARPVQVVYPQNRHLSVKVRVFVEWVADLFAAHPDLRPT
ncbi:LysR family transcriptional regulator [Massilia sp. TS11]|uniref:LysR substrate-binding domain-containing protein n=1 Tax=Massilia sp. TS11 TaxID=2908003 RepID=UPI001EDA5B4A|nr:LysR family transcriptional regulator [Massilia sp. TS11]MCG2584468.1 LysR family transcriptional regulator [Massilia sp. TS11]